MGPKRYLFRAVAATVIVVICGACNAATKKHVAAPMTMPAAAIQCTWGFTQDHKCVNPQLALDAQRSGLVFTQRSINRNFSPYLPPDTNVEHKYPILTNEWWTLRINSIP